MLERITLIHQVKTIVDNISNSQSQAEEWISDM
jgi:hypothetical protein